MEPRIGPGRARSAPGRTPRPRARSAPILGKRSGTGAPGRLREFPGNRCRSVGVDVVDQATEPTAKVSSISAESPEEASASGGLTEISRALG